MVVDFQGIDLLVWCLDKMTKKFTKLWCKMAMNPMVKNIKKINLNKQKNHCWLVVEPTHLKNISQNGNLPQVGMNIKNVWVATTQKNFELEVRLLWSLKKNKMPFSGLSAYIWVVRGANVVKHTMHWASGKGNKGFLKTWHPIEVSTANSSKKTNSNQTFSQ